MLTESLHGHTGKPTESFLPALAKKVSECFPELGGRSLSVSLIDYSKDTIPTLPIALIVAVKEKYKGGGQVKRVEVEELVAVEFWFEPVRYKTSSGTESPFWSYYDYSAIRDRLFTCLRSWRTPQGGVVDPKEMEISADHYTVAIRFELLHCFVFCPIEDDTPIYPVGNIAFTIIPAPTVCCDPECVEKKECEPCL